MLVRLFITLYLVSFILVSSSATHNRAGEITYRQIADLTLVITITTYTKASSTAADRDTLELFFGDGNSRRVGRSNGPNNRGELLGNDIKKNIYTTTYTYSGPGTYIISMTDPNRNGGILNLNFPSSENIQFHLETTVTFLNPLFEGFNSSPVLLNPPIQIGCVGQPFIHNPNAFDPDFDSLSYHLIVPLQDRNVNVPNYQFPNEINPGANNTIRLDSRTGDFIWTSPQRAGEYNITYIIREFRNGRLIGTVIRDLQILIRECENRPPRIDAIDSICVIAGETIEIPIVGTDPDAGQRIKMEANGGPFEFDHQPAMLLVAGGYQNPPLTGTLVWQTDCTHISSGYYNVIIKVEDNFFGDNGLSTLKTIRIKVTGPDVNNPLAENRSDLIHLLWDFPYTCDNTDLFNGFSIYRRNSSNNFLKDTCFPTMEGKGYTLIANGQQQTEDQKYIFIDQNAERGRIYCYRIVPEFARRTTAGFPINRSEGLPSKEICIQLNRDIPFLVQNSVLQTDPQNGEIILKWAKPYLLDFDTLQVPGPYTFTISRGQGINPSIFEPLPGATFTSPSFAALTDTIYTDTIDLNTKDFAYSYRISFFVENDRLYGISLPASSVFLNIKSSDRRNTLTWQASTPWENYQYKIFLFNESTSQFELIGETRNKEFTHRRLENGVKYCYKIETEGTYGVPDIDNPIFNFSQEICGVPIDTVPPCVPVLNVNNDCDLIDELSGAESLVNRLTWTDVRRLCEDSDDLTAYNIYYKKFLDDPFELIATITALNDTTYLHSDEERGLAGCYAVSAIDINGNESELSNIICMDNCPIYLLPNTFTPNGDGFNDLFVPRALRFINSVEFKVFNKWGNLVFETSDPMINWDGKNLKGQHLAEGSYYYTCTIFEEMLDGSTQQNRIRTGFIELIR